MTVDIYNISVAFTVKERMGTLRFIILLVGIAMGFTQAFAAPGLELDAVSGELTYKRTFQLSESLTEEQAFALVEGWLTTKPAKFTRRNTEAPNEDSESKNKRMVDEAFNNKRPIQSIDPYAKRIAARGLIKYYGGFNTSIHMLYIEYYMLFEIQGNKLTVTVSKLNYHHFNARTYAKQLIYNWQGGVPYKSNDALNTLMAGNIGNREIENLDLYLDNDMAKLFNDLGATLKAKASVASTGK